MEYAFVIEPKTYIAFDNESELIIKCKLWNLLSEKATKTKDFYYKRNGTNYSCQIIGFVDEVTAVVEFENKQQHCIHPSYLKEMQASSFSQRIVSGAEKDSAAKSIGDEQAKVAEKKETEKKKERSNVEVSLDEKKSNVEAQSKVASQPKPAGKAKKEKAPKFLLPEEKVKMSASVKEFTTVPNHFSDDDDEVVIYEDVLIITADTSADAAETNAAESNATEVGLAWSSHSATLKKAELEIGDKITFEAKMVKKKLTKHPVPYKINNPSKLQKVENE